jgi:hypothetical protein
VQLHIFGFEDERGSLQGIGSVVDLLPFSNNGESIVLAYFVHGCEEILFVESTAQARIFSLTVLQLKYVQPFTASRSLYQLSDT